MSGEKPKGKISPSLIIAVVVIIILLAALVYYATLPPKVEIVPTVVPTTIVQTALKTETLPGTTIVRTEVKTTVQTAVTTVAPTRPKLVIWGRGTFVPPQMYWVEKKAREWAAGKGVDVEITWIPVAEIGTKLISAVEAGAPPDLVINGHPVARFAEAGLLLPLDDIVEKLNESDIYEVKRAVCKWGGHYYAISTMFEITWIHARTDLIKKAGAENLWPPKNLEEVYELAKKLNDPAHEVWGLGIPLGLKGMDAWWQFQHYWIAYGGAMMESKTPEGVLIGKEPYRSGLKKAFEMYVKMWREGLTPPDSGEWVDASNNQAYINGRIAMAINPLSIYYALATSKPELAAVTSLAPVLPVSIDLGDESCFIFKTTKYPDLAKDLIYYLYKDKDDYTKGFCEASSWYAFPIFKSQVAKISERWKKGEFKYFAVDPAKVVEAIKYFESGSWPLLERNTVCEGFREGFIWTEMIQRVVLKGEDIDKIIDEYHNRFVEEIKRVYGGK
jgi:multiple sugar transport system substrate-binding protein